MGIYCMKQGAQTGALWQWDVIEGWDGVGGGREVQVGGDINMPMPNSCWINDRINDRNQQNPVKQLSSK